MSTGLLRVLVAADSLEVELRRSARHGGRGCRSQRCRSRVTVEKFVTVPVRRVEQSTMA